MRAKRLFILFLALVGAVTIQSTLLAHHLVLQGRPDLVLLLVVTFSVARGVSEGLVAGVLGGLLVDTLSGIPFGSATIGMCLIGGLTGLGDTNVYRSNLIIPLIAVFLATVIYHSFLMLALQADGRVVDWVATLALQTIPVAAMNSVLAPIALHFVRKFVARTEPEPEERFEW